MKEKNNYHIKWFTGFPLIQDDSKGPSHMYYTVPVYATKTILLLNSFITESLILYLQWHLVSDAANF